MTTMARRGSQAARPSIGVSSRLSYATIDWAEDDAWDSASDSDSPKNRPKNTSNHNTGRKGLESSVTPPRAVPNRNKSPSPSSSLNFSYTHISPPSSSTYQTRPDALHHQKTSWTIVNKSSEARIGASTRLEETQRTIRRRVSDELEVDDFVIAEVHEEGNESRVKDENITPSIRLDADEIVQGTKAVLYVF